jgi:exonuclease 3'-5' domain-containing protein 1
MSAWKSAGSAGYPQQGGSRRFLSIIPPASSLYLNLEATYLSRNGDVSVMAIVVIPETIVRIVDVQSL